MADPAAGRGRAADRAAGRERGGGRAALHAADGAGAARRRAFRGRASVLSLPAAHPTAYPAPARARRSVSGASHRKSHGAPRRKTNGSARAAARTRGWLGTHDALRNAFERYYARALPAAGTVP